MVDGQRGGRAEIARGVALDSSVVRETLAEFGRDALTAAKRGLYVLAEEIMTESKKRVPVDTGNLRASGHVLPAEREGGRLRPAGPRAVRCIAREAVLKEAAGAVWDGDGCPDGGEVPGERPAGVRAPDGGAARLVAHTGIACSLAICWTC